MPKTFTEFFAKFKNDFSQRSKKTLFAILPRQALALMPFCEYDCEPGGGGGAPGGGVGGTGGGDLNPLSTPLNPLDPMAYHMWFEELPAPATLQGGISQRQVLINLPGVSTTTIYGTTDTTTATNQFGISNLSFIQEVPRPTAADLQQLTSYQNYQISALTYRASFGQPYWISYEDWRRQIYSNSYMGVTGPIGVPTNAGPQPSISINQSPDGRTFEIFASLPGEISMCGGFFSPLMVFFDKKYPSFENITDFKMMHEFKTYWPEASHAGYFIGMLNKNNKIESYTDLFGEDMNVRNGFEKLAQYDANKDGKIDARDPIFKKLVLWKDKKGQGIFNKKDIIALSQKIKSINLKYKNEFEMISLGAEFRQRASFTFISKGKLKNGEVIDVWLKPYHADQNRSVAQSKHEAQ